MMENGLAVPLSQQTLWFAASIAVGGLDVLIYVVFRAVVRHTQKAATTIATDILYFLVIAVVEFVFITLLPHNALRWFHIVGHTAGAVVVWLGIAPTIFRLTERLFVALCRCGVFIKRICSKNNPHEKTEEDQTPL